MGTDLPSFYQDLPVDLSIHQILQIPSGGSEIAPENQQQSQWVYAVDETAELDGWEH